MPRPVLRPGQTLAEMNEVLASHHPMRTRSGLPITPEIWAEGLRNQDVQEATWRYVDRGGKVPDVLHISEREAFNEQRKQENDSAALLDKALQPRQFKTSSDGRPLDLNANPYNPFQQLVKGIQKGWAYGTRDGPVQASEYFGGPIGTVLNKQGRAALKEIQQTYGTTGLAGALVGNTVGHVAGLWPARIPWRLNLDDLFATYLYPAIANKTFGKKGDIKAGLYEDPLYNAPSSSGRELRLPRGYLLPGIAAGGLAAGIASGNVNALGLFNTVEGPRMPGYRASQSDYDTPTQVGFFPLAAAEVLTGGSNRPLKWEQFRKERPEISKQRYDDYMKYYYGDTEQSEQPGDWELLNGAIKFTPNNLEGMPELRALGARYTPFGVVAGVGAAAGTYALIQKLLRR